MSKCVSVIECNSWNSTERYLTPFIFVIILLKKESDQKAYAKNMSQIVNAFIELISLANMIFYLGKVLLNKHSVIRHVSENAFVRAARTIKIIVEFIDKRNVCRCS